MLDFEFDKATRVLTINPAAPLEKADFVDLGKTVDPEIEASGDLAGLIIDVPHFKGWDGLGALVSHLRFVNGHQEHVKKIAVVTDSHLGDLAEHLVSHFVAAEVHRFPAGQTAQARQWITGETAGA